MEDEEEFTAFLVEIGQRLNDFSQPRKEKLASDAGSYLGEVDYPHLQALRDFIDATLKEV